MLPWSRICGMQPEDPDTQSPNKSKKKSCKDGTLPQTNTLSLIKPSDKPISICNK
jgi:hypothetical protein